MSVMELLIGPIASGKSSYSRRRAREGAIIVNDGALVMAIHAQQYTLYGEELRGLYTSIEGNLIFDAAMLGRDIVIDRTNLAKHTRLRYIETARVLGISAVGTIFPIDTPEIHARRRSEADSRGVSQEKWERICRLHLSQYTPPSLEEGFMELPDSVTVTLPHAKTVSGWPLPGNNSVATLAISSPCGRYVGRCRDRL